MPLFHCLFSYFRRALSLSPLLQLFADIIFADYFRFRATIDDFITFRYR